MNFVRSFTVIALLALAAAAPAGATFAGEPGPIAYSKSAADELASTGGIFIHPPQLRAASRALTRSDGDSTPTYSSDGRFIAFVGNHDAVAPGSFPKGRHIYVMDADGRDVRQLTSGDNYDSNPAFSRGGSVVVFDRRIGSSSTAHLFSVSVKGGEPRQLTTGTKSDSEPTYAPDGRHIVFTSNRRSDNEKNRSAIFWMRPDGSALRPLVDTRRNDGEPDMSPDGKRLLFMSNRSGGNGIHTFNMATGNVRAVGKPVTTCIRRSCFSNPVYSPDGRHIAALYSGTYGSSLVVMRPDGTNTKNFAEGGTEEEGYGTRIGPPAWGPQP